MKTALNSYDTMNQYEINNLINEFNKDKNIIAKMPDVGDLLRVEIYKNGKEHYYLNVAGFFDPDRGFLKALGEIYERYNEIKNITRKDLMPFTSLMMQPFEKIMEILEIRSGTFLHLSLALVYAFAFGAGIGAIVGVLFSINPVLGGIGICVAGIGYGIEAYEVYKANKHYKYKNYLQEQGNLFISKINELFKKDYNRCIIDYNCNIIEIIIDESFNSILDGIFNFDNKKKNSVVINYWNIPEIIKAKGIKDYPSNKKEMYSYIVEKLQFCTNDKQFFKLYEELKRKYHTTYKEAKRLSDKSKKLDEVYAILDEIEKYEKIDPYHPEIDKLNKKLREIKKKKKI